MEISPLAKRVAARHLKALEEVNGASMVENEHSGASMIEHEMPGQPEGHEQTAIPKSGPGKSVMMKQLIQLKEALERSDHDAFKKGLDGLNSLFQKSTHVRET